MFDRLKSLLGEERTGRGRDDDALELRVAACALLLELAWSDDEFGAVERSAIESALATHFGLGPAEARELMALAEERRREAVDLHEFTSVIAGRYDEAGRAEIARLLWKVVDADGTFTQHEAYLLRRLGHALDLRPGLLNAVRDHDGP